ncbi:MAG: hypothetical protein JO117_05125 [Verrucomicrobia bacterium]|nr:hypothetical protein [Verrucomicrobiota bacterium]
MSRAADLPFPDTEEFAEDRLDEEIESHLGLLWLLESWLIFQATCRCEPDRTENEDIANTLNHARQRLRAAHQKVAPH